MAKYRFSWDAFDDKTVEALADAWGYNERTRPMDRRTWLSEVKKRPDDDFVFATKDILIDTWLAQYNGTPNIVDELIRRGLGGSNRRPRSTEGMLDFIRNTRNTVGFREPLLDALHRYGSHKRETTPSGSFPAFSQFVPADQSPDTREPHVYQRDAWQHMTAELGKFDSNHKFHGMLVMPTGSGKTFTATRWLMENHVNRGKRVLWIAHRHELLEQAGDAFLHSGAVATKRKLLRMRLVSGRHCSAHQIDPGDDIVLASVYSLARRPDVADELLSDPNLFLIVDEAHHSVAKTYRDLIERLTGRSRDRVTPRPFRLLGLTATPTRTVDAERAVLHRLFGEKPIYEIELRKLIDQGFLAIPIPVHVKTQAEVEEGVTPRDRAFAIQFNDLSEEWLDRIAHMTQRNRVIVQEYLGQREKYGKTLIFAINVLHAKLLTDELKAARISAEYVASHRPDGEAIDNQEVIRRFRDPDEDLEVLVNVQILTEGVDVPKIQTVFLTRPTSSDILLRQMIGRALRGPKAGGTEVAYIVSFEDHWKKFRDWESPLDLVADITAPEEPVVAQLQGEATKTELVAALPWDLIQSTASELRRRIDSTPVERFEAVPDGWYVLERESEGLEVRQIIHVHAHQKPSWAAFISWLSSLDEDALGVVSAEDAFEEFFGDCDDPAPSQYRIGEMIAHFSAGGETPEYSTLVERAEIAPHSVAAQIVARDLGENRKRTELQKLYERPLARAIYDTLREYTTAVNEAIFALQNPRDAEPPPKGVPIFEDLPDTQLRPGPHHDLTSLWAGVSRQAATLLPDEPIQTEIVLEWSKRPIKGWFGYAWWDRPNKPGELMIRLNRLLDSPDVSAETIRYLLWHEYLHIHLRGGHTKQFRELERKWPNALAGDRELDGLNEKFGLQWW